LNDVSDASGFHEQRKLISFGGDI